MLQHRVGTRSKSSWATRTGLSRNMLPPEARSADFPWAELYAGCAGPIVKLQCLAAFRYQNG